MNSVTKLVTALAVFICSSAGATAATLQAKVVEVPSGNTLVVSNTSRSVHVRLKSVVPPETGQPFSEAARDHLRALVLDQAVMVDYTHLVNGYLEARVFLKGIDIGSQMLRDGVAWYDHATDYELTESDRDLYAQCEQAARAEKRGLWHDESPLAPWEYRRIQQAKIDEIQYGKSGLRSKSSLASTRTSLSNNDLMPTLMGGAGSSNGLPQPRRIVENGSFDRWTSFESPVQHFSIMIPSNGVETSGVVKDNVSGLPVIMDILAAGSERGFVSLTAGRGPNNSFTDASALDKSLKPLIDGWNEGASKHGSGGVLTLGAARDLKLAGYAGKQYTLTGELVSGIGRVFTKQIGAERQIFVLIAITRLGSEDVANQFLNSFKITQ